MDADWHTLEAALGGEVVRPGAPDYERLRRPAIRQFDGVRPQALVLCAGPQDVASTA